MLEKLPNHSLTNEEDRVRYTDGSTSVTIWFDVDNSIFAFEVIFDLLLKEFVLLYSKKSPTRFINIDDGTSKPGRTVKQSIGSQSLNFPTRRLDEFRKVSANIPAHQREFILEIMVSINR